MPAKTDPGDTRHLIWLQCYTADVPVPRLTILLGLCFLMSACFGGDAFALRRPPRKKKVPKPPPETEGPIPAALVAIAKGERPCRELRGRYRDGNDTLGTTTISLWGGWAKVVRRMPGVPEEIYRGRIGRTMCLRLVRNATERRLWRVRQRRRKAVDDETRPLIRLGVKGVGSFTVRVWGFDVQDQPGFAVARGQLLALAIRLSGGKVTF